MDQLKFAISLAICLFLSNLAPAQSLNWESDVDLAKNMAAKEGKLVLLHFTAQWCRPCKQLETFVFSSPNVVSAIEERFIPVKIDTDKNPELVKQYDVDSIPLDIVISHEGRVLQKRQSPKDSNNFLRMIKAVDNADTQYAERNAVISKKIGEVLQEIEQGGSTPVSKHNDISVKTPELSTVEPSKAGQQLLAKNKTRLVDHKTEATIQNATMSNKTATAVASIGPQRVINDRFFAEKTHAAQQVAQSKQPAATVPVQQRPAQNVESFATAAVAAKSNPVQTKLVQQDVVNREQMAIPSAGEFVPATRKSAPLTPTAPKTNDFVVGPNNQPVANSTTAVPGKIVVDAVKENLALQAEQVASQRVSSQPAVSAKIVAAGKDPARAADPRYPNSLRNQSVANQSLVRGQTADTVRDSVQKMFDTEKQPVVKQAPATSSKFGLGGKCPVSLVQDGKWVLGDKKFGCVHRGRVYLFANADKLAAFQAEPEKFSPILAGYDPVVFHKEGELVEGAEKHGVFMGKAPNHRIVLFQTQQSRDEFQKNPKKYMTTVRLAIQQSDSIR